MSIQVGLHMCGWGDHPLPDVLVAARELGYDGVELAPAWLEAAYGLDRLGHMLADEGVALAPAVFVGGLSLDEQRLPNLLATARRYARWMKAHGAHKAIYSTCIKCAAGYIKRNLEEIKLISKSKHPFRPSGST